MYLILIYQSICLKLYMEIKDLNNEGREKDNMYVIICDLDNCFTDSREWGRFIPETNDRKAWDDYLDMFYLCKPNQPVIDLVTCTAEILPVYFVTGREDRKQNRHHTIQQIKDYTKGAINMFDPKSHHKLLMRAELDYRPSQDVKEEILKLIVQSGHSPVVAIDDEEENCKMFCRYGIPTVLYKIDTNEFIRYGGPRVVQG